MRVGHSVIHRPMHVPYVLGPSRADAKGGVSGWLAYVRGSSDVGGFPATMRYMRWDWAGKVPRAPLNWRVRKRTNDRCRGGWRGWGGRARSSPKNFEAGREADGSFLAGSIPNGKEANIGNGQDFGEDSDH